MLEQGPAEGAPLTIQQVMEAIPYRNLARMAAIVEVVFCILEFVGIIVVVLILSQQDPTADSDAASFEKNVDAEFFSLKQQVKENMRNVVLIVLIAVLIATCVQVGFSVLLIEATSRTSVIVFILFFHYFF